MKNVFKMIVIFTSVLCHYGAIAQTGLSAHRNYAPPQYKGIKTHSQMLKYNLKTPNKSVKMHFNTASVDKKAQPMPLVFSAEHLPFFCKIEYRIESQYKIPFKFRLGDVQYVDELEGK